MGWALRGCLRSIFQYGLNINCRGNKGLRACRHYFEVMLKQLIFHALVVATRGLSPLSPTIR